MDTISALRESQRFHWILLQWKVARKGQLDPLKNMPGCGEQLWGVKYSMSKIVDGSSTHNSGLRQGILV